ncbi:transmembrane protein, putative [Medicago truncatula]|uniref:Transmembrane protein, putative n=1 Tax=Medicago truncatula TaxID=3880 RepID=G7JT69_MEDTR|nr:transmembrane protein, putative [Medicago truncatula]
MYSHKSYQQVVALAEWLRRVPAKYMGFPRESSNLSGDVLFLFSILSLFLFASDGGVRINYPKIQPKSLLHGLNYTYPRFTCVIFLHMIFSNLDNKIC